MLARDEEANLPAALGSVPRGSPMLVVDSESTDATADRACELGAEVVVRPWAGFVATRRFALSLVRTDWTFMLDADERLDDDLRDSLLRARPVRATDAYLIRRVNYFCGRPMRGGAWGNDEPLRLFRTARATLVAEPASGGEADLHERWIVPGQIARLEGAILHNSYPTLGSYRKKFGRYTTIEARGLRPSIKRFAIAALELVPRFAFTVSMRGGWRDGWRGVFVAIASAAYPLVASWKALRARER